MKRSIRANLLLTLVSSLVVMFFLLWLAVSHSLRTLTANYLEDRMELEIESILAEMAVGEDDNISLDGRHVDALFHFAFSGYYYQIRLDDPQGEPQILRSRSLENFVLKVPEIPLGDKVRLNAKGPKNQNLLMLVRSLPLRERVLTISVAEDLTPIDEDLQAFQVHYTLISTAFLLVLTLIHVVAVHRAMLPIKVIRQEIQQLEEGRIMQLSEEVPEEMSRVVAQINQLLQKMAQRLDRSRTTIANLSHSLKGPLITLSQMIHHPVVNTDEALRQEMEERLTTIHALVERELRRARLADHSLPGRFFYPDKEVNALVRTLKSINFQKNIQVSLDFPQTMLMPFDQEDMMELLGNLLDNAFKWAGHKIHLQLRETPQAFVLLLEDDGPGVADEEVAHLAQRGVRLDESRAGHGMGLSIVREIVSHYLGEVRFGRSPHLGGFLVEVTLPSR